MRRRRTRRPTRCERPLVRYAASAGRRSGVKRTFISTQERTSAEGTQHRPAGRVLHVRDPSQQLLEGDAHLHARQVRAEAEVRADAEAEVRRIALDAEARRAPRRRRRRGWPRGRASARAGRHGSACRGARGRASRCAQKEWTGDTMPHHLLDRRPGAAPDRRAASGAHPDSRSAAACRPRCRCAWSRCPRPAGSRSSIISSSLASASARRRRRASFSVEVRAGCPRPWRRSGSLTRSSRGSGGDPR